MLLDDDKETLSFKVATGEKGGVVQKMKVKVGQGIAGLVAKEQKPLIVNDVSKDPRFNALMDKTSGFVTRSIICVPMMIEKELIGIVEVLNKNSGGEFDDNDTSALESVASLAAVSINNARTSEDQRNFFVNIIEILTQAIESKNKNLSGHSWRVAQLSTSLAKQMKISEKVYKDIYYGALLHDIGIINIHDDLSINEGIVTVRGRDAETNHPKLGSEMIKNINLLKGAVAIVRHHHENFDGTGYPDGIKGEAIPLGARIVAVAEAVDEMRMSGLAEEKVRAMLKLGQETRFDPEIVGLFLKEFFEAAV